MATIFGKQTIPNADLGDTIQDGCDQPNPNGGQGSSTLYQDVDIYQILVADLVIHHKEILRNIPLDIAMQTMKSAWKVSHDSEEGLLS